VARIELATPAGPEHIIARLVDGLAMAITTGARIRVAEAVMERIAVPAGATRAEAGQDGPTPEHTARDLAIDDRPRYEPRNLTFAAGLDGWGLGGSFTENAIASHWQDYSVAADAGVAVLSAAVPRPAGFAFLAQQIHADDYRGADVVFKCQVRVAPDEGRAGLFLRVRKAVDIGGPLTQAAARADPDNHIVMADGRDWNTREVIARIPDDTDTILFGVFLVGPGRIELRDPRLT